MTKAILFASLAAVAMAAPTASAQMSSAKLEDWLCSFFAKSEPQALLTFPDYGVGNISTRTKENAAGVSTVNDVATQAYKLSFSQRISKRTSRVIGNWLTVEAKTGALWDTNTAAETALGRTGRVRRDKELDEIVAEGAADRNIGGYNWTARFDLAGQKLSIDWLDAASAASAQGFCRRG